MFKHRTVRHFMGLLAGAILGFAIVALVETAGHMLFPPPPGTDLSRTAAMAGLMESVPFPAKLFVVLAWFLGAAVGGWVAGRIAREPRSAWIMAGLFIVMTALTIASIPHPLWMVVAGLAAPLLGAWVASMGLARRL